MVSDEDTQDPDIKVVPPFERIEDDSIKNPPIEPALALIVPSNKPPLANGASRNDYETRLQAFCQKIESGIDIMIRMALNQLFVGSFELELV